MASSEKRADVFVVGGGPAGLAAAISLRRAGMDVVVADSARPPIDKACGEGLMPDAIDAVRQLGIDLPSGYGRRFRGISFCTPGASVTARFAQGHGMGIRRTMLHKLLVNHAAGMGVRMMWQTRAEVIDGRHVAAGGEAWAVRWIIGADGQRSRIRQFAGLAHKELSQRYGFRQHFRVDPWSDCVEVHWAAEGQAYVTPTADDEVCVALVTERKGNRMPDVPRMFPELGRRLAGCEPVSTERGAISICRKLPRVTRGSIALIGEAAGSVDAVTAEGLALAFKQAVALGEALPLGRPELYEASNRKVRRTPFLMSRIMVFSGRHLKLQERVIRASEQDASLFSHLLAVHLGMRSPLRVSPAVLTTFGWNFATA